MAATHQRMSAEDRREAIVEIALRAFGEGGLHGTSTEAIAVEAGVSQPYLFRLFKTKRELYLACCRACVERTQAAFEIGAEAAGDDSPPEGMGPPDWALPPDRW